MGRACQDTALGFIQFLFLHLAGVTPELWACKSTRDRPERALCATLLPRHLPRYEELRDLTTRLEAINPGDCGSRIFTNTKQSFMRVDNFHLTEFTAKF
jgi:hypothetical protein